MSILTEVYFWYSNYSHTFPKILFACGLKGILEYILKLYKLFTFTDIIELNKVINVSS